MTAATWMRRFVLNHEAYQQDSRVSPAVAHDLMVAAVEIGEGRRPCPELVGEAAEILPLPKTAEEVAARGVAVPEPWLLRPRAACLCGSEAAEASKTETMRSDRLMIL